jgi:hypothetical protein
LITDARHGVYRASYQGVLKEAVGRPHMPGVEEAGSRDVYALALAPELNDLIGRLYLDWGAGKLSWLQYANRQEKPVTELLTAFKEEGFPGFGAFMAPSRKSTPCRPAGRLP